MHDEAHVLLVDAHAEGRRGHDHLPARRGRDPPLLARRALLRAQPRVVRRRADALRLQRRSERVARAPHRGVDDAGHGVGALAAAGQLDLSLRVVAAAGVDALQPGAEVLEPGVVLVGGEADLVVQVGAGDGGGEGFKRVGGEAEGVDDVVADLRRGGGGKADDGDAGKGGAEVGQVQEGCAEVVAPLADAVGLVDGDAGQLVLGVDGAQRGAEGFRKGVLGRDVEEAGARVPALQVGQDSVARRAVRGAVQRGHGDARGFQLRHLVLHQRQQRRDADGDAVVQHRRQLIAERLAEGGGGLHEDIVALERRGDDLFLAGSGLRMLA